MNFKKLGLTYDKVNNINYATGELVEFEKLKLKHTKAEVEQNSINIAQFLTSKNAVTVDLGYPESLQSVLDIGEVACMRLGFVPDVSGQLHLIEINSQTPSFWWECEDGADAVLKENNIMRQPKYQANLSSCLYHNLKNSDSIGLITCDANEDIFQMQFIANKIKALNIASHVEVLTINRMDINNHNQIFSLNTDKVFDTILMWYPLEWLATDTFADGTPVAAKFVAALKNTKVFNGISAFMLQNKNFLAYACEFWDEIENQDLWIAPTYYTLEDLKLDLGDVPYIGKPIFGRQGAGIFGEDTTGSFSGDLSDDYYNNQLCIYQEKYETLPLILNQEVFNYTYEQWVYKDTDWKIGGSALRITPHLIVDDNSRWVTLY